jgi:hypothetical protein
MLFTCRYCGAKDAIALSPGGSPLVVCTGCRKPQPRRIYEGQDPTGPTALPPRTFGILPIVVFVGLAVLGFGGVALLGVPAPGGFGVNAVMIVAGAAASMLGTWVAKNPTSFMVSRNMGTDASGTQQWGPSQRATRGQGLVNGLVAVGVGIVMVALGVFLGVLSRTR